MKIIQKSLILALFSILPLQGMNSVSEGVREGVPSGSPAYKMGYASHVAGFGFGFVVASILGLGWIYYGGYYRKWRPAIVPDIPHRTQMLVGNRIIEIENYYASKVMPRRNVFIYHAEYNELRLPSTLKDFTIMNTHAVSGAVAVIYQKGLQTPYVKNILTAACPDNTSSVYEEKIRPLEAFLGESGENKYSLIINPTNPKTSFVTTAAFEHEIYLPVGHSLKISYQTKQGIEKIVR